MNLLYNKNRIDPIFVCRAVQHLANMSDCVNARKETEWQVVGFATIGTEFVTQQGSSSDAF
jgi:hypothetical protein